MKKLLGLTVALAMVVPSVASAELLKNLKVGGSLDVDAVESNNVSDYSTKNYDHRSTVQTRLLVNTDWDLLDDVHAHMTISKNNRTYGSGANASENLNTVQTSLLLDEASVRLDKLFGSVDMTLGRQFYGDPGDLVIYFGPKMGEYTMPVTALDGGRFDWKGEKMGVTLLAAKTTGVGVAIATVNGNVNLAGIDVRVKASDSMSGGAYLYNQTTINSGARAPGANVTGSDKLYVLGAKGKMTMGNAWMKAEIAKNFGQNRTVAAAAGNYTFTGNYTGWALKLDGGYKADVGGVGAVTGWGQYGLGSGGGTTNRNFTAIAGDYRPGGIFGRFIAPGVGGSPVTFNSTLNDLQVIGLGVKVNPATLSKLTAGLSYYNYRLQSQANANLATNTLTGLANQGGSKAFGGEYDLDLTWQHSENVSVAAGMGSFQPGSAIGHVNHQLAATAGSVSPVTMCYMDFGFKF